MSSEQICRVKFKNSTLCGRLKKELISIILSVISKNNEHFRAIGNTKTERGN